MGDGFDEVVEAAWGRFEAWLVDELQGLGGRWLVLGPAVDAHEGCTPYVQFLVADDELRVEVSSNRSLGPSVQMSGRDHKVLRALGFTEPGRGDDEVNWRATLPRDLAPHVVGMATATLRQVFGVVTPDFLHVDGVEGWTDSADEEEVVETERFGVEFPGSSDELGEMVSRLLAERGQGDCHPDEDGDFTLVTDSGLIFCEVRADMPVITFWGCVLDDVRRHDQALLEVNVLNRRVPLMRFTLFDGGIHFRSDLTAAPVVGAQFHSRVDYIFDQLQTLEVDLDHRINGFTDPRSLPPKPTRESA